MIGKVYKLTNPNCKICYIGSTYCKYTSVRFAHHRQSNNRGTMDYQGLFNGQEPDMEILQEIEMPNGKDDAWKLRKLEQEYEENTINTINSRRCYVSPEEKRTLHNSAVEKYQNSVGGKLACRKGNLNAKLKRVSPFDGSLIKQIKSEIKFICDLQNSLKVE